MKLREKFKRFWTMDVHNHEGFTLVELIIVIAILAILSGVAVAGYSAYIKKANIQADKTMAAEIKNALLLAMYSDELTAGDDVVVNFNGTATAGNINSTATTAAAAMEAAFGSNWQSALELKYGEWDVGVVADSTLMGYVQNSGFSTDNLDDLLTSVQGITDQFNGVLEEGKVTIAADSDLAKYLEGLGIDYSTDTQAASNATVLYVGNTFANTNVSDDDFYAAWMNLDFSAVTDDQYAASAARYAAILALAQHIDGLKGTTYVATLNAATGTDVLTTATTVSNELVSTYRTEALEYFGINDSGYDKNSKGYADAMAFKAYMLGMDSATDSLVGSTDLSSNTYFTDGAVLSYVTNYVNVGEIMSVAGAAENSFVFIYDGVNIICVPLDY